LIMSDTAAEAPPPFLPATPEGVARAAELLRAGQVVALPTETVYGLAAHALDEKAVRQIFSIKGRPLIDPLIVHGLDADFLSALACFTPQARRLAEACWPGPLTLVLKKHAVVPGLVTAGRDTVAVRVPAHPLARAVLKASGLPLAAPSANPFGYISPTRAEHVRASFGAKVPWILEGGACAVGLESTILEVSDPTTPPRLLRPGPITVEALALILGQPIEVAAPSKPADETQGLVAPGLLARHYSPRTSLVLLESAALPPMAVHERTAWIRLSRPAQGDKDWPANLEVFWLCETGDLGQAAHGLYELLRRLDEAGFARIYCELAAEAGIGAALNDRLRRAAGRG
jgi:L-threonylcarbamoyladenylate synthase